MNIQTAHCVHGKLAVLQRCKCKKGECVCVCASEFRFTQQHQKSPLSNSRTGLLASVFSDIFINCLPICLRLRGKRRAHTPTRECAFVGFKSDGTKRCAMCHMDWLRATSHTLQLKAVRATGFISTQRNRTLTCWDGIPGQNIFKIEAGESI